MHLQWFPGHMTRAMRMMEEEVKLVDGVIYVLDSRAPFACLNNNLSKLFGSRPVLYVLNKADLVNENELSSVIKKFESEGKVVIANNCNSDKCGKKLYEAIFKLLAFKVERNKSKGLNKPIRVMVAGIPNTGKSTIINLLTGGKRAKTGDKAGVTKDKQWIKIKDLELLDTPGTMPPSFDNQVNASFLAYLGSINDDILDFCELSVMLITYLEKEHKGLLTKVYNIETDGVAPYDILGKIAIKRGAIKKGNEIDEDRASSILINDLRKGKLGKILFI